MKARLTLLGLGLALLLAAPACAPPSQAVKHSPDIVFHTRKARSFLQHRLARLAALQNSDGTWGRITLLGDHWIDQTGITALVILAFIEAGYTHLCRDELDGIKVGPAIKKGLHALMRRQMADGSFATSGDPTVNQSLGTWALSEAYGMTATSLFKESARRAVEAFQRRFSRASGWGDDAQAAWAAFAFWSAHLGELGIDETLAPRTLEFSTIRNPSSNWSALAAASWDRFRGRADLKPAAEQARNRPVGDDLLGAYVDSMIVFYLEGCKGEGLRTRARAFSITLPDRKKPSEHTRTDSLAILRLVLESFHLSIWFWQHDAERHSELIAEPPH